MHPRFSPVSVSFLLATAIVAPPASAQAPAVQWDQPVTDQLRSLLTAAYPADGPGGSVLISRGGRTIFAGGQGMADVAAQKAITPETSFYLGSITKTLTATLILKLVQEGKLSLEDPISRHLTNFPEPAAKATVRQLLNHNSGLMDYSKIPGFISENRDKHFATAALLDLMRGQEPVSAPGEKWE